MPGASPAVETLTRPQYVLSRPGVAPTEEVRVIPSSERLNVHSPPDSTSPGTIPEACTAPSTTSSVMTVTETPSEAVGSGCADVVPVGVGVSGVAVGDGDEAWETDAVGAGDWVSAVPGVARHEVNAAARTSATAPTTTA